MAKHEVPEDRVLLISTAWEFVDHLILLGSKYQISYEETASFEKGLELSLQRDLKYLTIKPKLISKGQVALAHENGVRVVTFGGKSKYGAADLIELSPNVVHANNIDAMRELLEE